ncbi:MAG TPA: FxSxx-COOH system tetratricopeptide repeat protein [Streptosporangiaceae bacterium]|nr:FxSxx-COOH system tetratricopeptide repeat protein [Streptosporangiaceae bacterium]
MRAGDESPQWDFFVSYTQADQAWAEWIAWQLEQDRHRVLVQAWDFVGGTNWIARMHDGTRNAARRIAVLSPDYLDSQYGGAEWQAAWGANPDGSDRKLLTVRVRECERPGLLAAVVGTDLFGIDEAKARARLRSFIAGALKGRIVPEAEPQFPGRAITREPRFPGALPQHWKMPARNPNFTGRTRELADLRRRMTSGSPVTVQTVHGMGGVGKTQLAVEYAHAHAADYDLVWLIAAEEPAAIPDQFEALGKRLRLEPGGGPEALRERVHDALREVPGWLLVFDNADAVAEISPWLPPDLLAAGIRGHVLITTRRGGFAGLGQVMDLDVIDLPEAVQLLRTRVRDLGRIVGEEIAERLGRLPLALEQAAAYLDQSKLPPEEYAELLRSRAADLFGRGTVTSHSETIATLWDISLERISDLNQAAIQLLQLCAYLAPEPIPLELFTRQLDRLPEPLASAAADRLAFTDTIAVLVDYSLARRSSGGLDLHRLVQDAVRDGLSSAEAAETRDRTEAILAHGHPGDPSNPAIWPRWAPLMPHLLAADLAGTDNPELRFAACDACWYLLARGYAHSAHVSASRLYERWRDRLGADDPDTLMMAHYLAWALEGLGDYPAAVERGQDTLDRRRRVLGWDDRSTLRTAINLVAALGQLGRMRDARDLAEDTLDRMRRTLGEDHRSTLAVAGNLVEAMRKLGETAAALELGQDTLRRSRRVLSEDHPITLTAAGNVAAILRDAGDPQAGRELGRDTLSRMRCELGEDHPSTLEIAIELAVTLHALGSRRTARELAEDALDRMRRVLGEDHPGTKAAIRAWSDAQQDDGGSP